MPLGGWSPYRLAVRADPADPAKIYAYYMPDIDDFALVHVVDVSNPDVLVQGANIDRPVYINTLPAGITLDGSDAYLVSTGGDVNILDISIPYILIPFTGTFEYDSSPTYSIAAQGDFLYFAAGSDGLEMFAKTSDENVAFYRMVTRVYEATPSSSCVLLAGGKSGLYAVWAGPSTYEDIQTSGGSLTSLFDGTSYSFPDGAFSQNSGVTHHPLYPFAQPMPAATKRLAGPVFDVYQQAWNGETYYTGLPFTLTGPYDPAKLGGVPEDSLHLYRLEDSTWIQVNGIILDSSGNTLSAALTQFGTYALFGELEAGGYNYLPLVSR